MSPAEAKARNLNVLRLREVERQLTAEHHAALEHRRILARRMREIFDAVPSEVPAPDSNLQIVQVTREYQAAIENSNTALQRLVDFIVHKTIPPDLDV
jgi:hypothetical protein